MRTALITGASGKTGRALVRHLLDADTYRVLAVGRDEARLRSTISGSTRPDERLVTRRCDLRSPEDVDGLVSFVQHRLGGVDALLHLAAVRAEHPLASHPLGDFRDAVDVSLTSGFLLMRGLVPDMAASGWGRVVVFAGSSVHSGARGRVGMLAAKAGLIGLTKGVALEYASAGVTANVVSPGTISGGAGEPRRSVPPVGRPGTVEEVVACCTYLLSDAAGYVTGQTLLVNGGAYLP